MKPNLLLISFLILSLFLSLSLISPQTQTKPKKKKTAAKNQTAKTAWDKSRDSLKLKSDSAAKKIRNEIAWVTCRAGTFFMGSPVDEVDRHRSEIRHQVTLKAFKMAKYDITCAQYDLFCDMTARPKVIDTGWSAVCGNKPAINISWYDAVAFADWVGCRLPTEAEYEYAERAGTTTIFYTGDNITTDWANYDGAHPYRKNPKGKSRLKTMPVGSLPANGWGLYDMAGNVHVWCSDWMADLPADDQANPTGPDSGWYKISRGGDWRNWADGCRSASRGWGQLGRHNPEVGIRLVFEEEKKD